MESERRRDGEMSSDRAAAQAHDRINLLLDRIHELTEDNRKLSRGIESTLDDASKIDRLGAALARAEAERDELKQRLEAGHVCTPACRPNQHVAFVGRAELKRQLEAARHTAIEEALTEVSSALDGWIEGARSNCDALGHRGHNSGEQCGDIFGVSDIRAMIVDARRELVMPVVAVEDGGIGPVAVLMRRLDAITAERDELARQLDSAHEINASVSKSYLDEQRHARKQAEALDEVLAFVRHDHCTTNCGGTDHVVHESLSVAGLVQRHVNRVTADLLAERDEARDERDRWKNAYENAAETKRAAVEQLTAERDAWKQQANDDAERFVRAAERAGSEQQRVDEVASELETALRQRDAAHGVIANLRAVLANVVNTLDDLDPNTGQEKVCNCGATSLLPRLTDPNCPYHGTDAS